MKKKKSIKKYVLVFLVLLILMTGLAVLDFYMKVAAPFKEYRESIFVEVPKGASVTAVARLLQEKKIIPSALYFRIYYRFYFKDARFRSGEYQFDKPMTMREIMEMMVQGRVMLHRVTIREGLMIKEVAEEVARQRGIPYEEFLEAAKNTLLISDWDQKADDLEGYLFPDTYHVRRDINAEELVKLMVERFKENFTHTMRWRTDQLNWTVRQVLAMASLIEKETSSREERFLIASVFHNRLKTGMTLGCDPSIIYALKRDGAYNGKLGWKELKYDSPYNTRLYKDLPPGPICNPGAASIEAALYPDNTEYLYFVAKNPQSHYFSKNLDEHNWAVRKYIINRR